MPYEKELKDLIEWIKSYDEIKVLQDIEGYLNTEFRLSEKIYREAFKVCKNELETNPNNILALVCLINLHYRSRDYYILSRLLNSLFELLNKIPNLKFGSSILTWLCQIYSKTNEFDRFQKFFKKILEIEYGDKSLTEIVNIKGEEILLYEAVVLKELELYSDTSIKPDENVDRYSDVIFLRGENIHYSPWGGFKVENKHITGLGIYNANLLTLPKSIGNLSELKELYLQNTKLSTIPDSLFNLKLLEMLDMGFNQLTSVPDTIKNSVSLRKLVLKSNKLLYLPETIGNLSNLKILEVNNNKINALPESIGKLSNLVELICLKNRISKLPESIGNLTSLKNLDASVNTLINLPGSIGKLSNLEILFCFKNRISKLPESIGMLKSLNILWLDDNKLNILPESIGNLKSLTNLSLSNNSLNTVPVSIGELKNLEELNINNNDLHYIPTTLAKLSSLKELYIEHNCRIYGKYNFILILDRLKNNGVKVYPIDYYRSPF